MLPLWRRNFAVGAQHDDVARRKVGDQDQAIERIVLDRASPDLTESLFHARPGSREVDAMMHGGSRLELLDPDRFGRIRRPNLEGDLVDNVQAEIFQHRQDVGQRYRLTTPDRFEAQFRSLAAGQRHGDVLAREHGLD